MRSNNKIFLSLLIVCLIVQGVSISYADTVLYDKKGLIVETITKPTAENKIDDENVSDAIRKSNSDVNKNINSKATIIQAESNLVSPKEPKDYTLIRHMVSINHIDDNQYEIIQDVYADRLMVKILGTGVGGVFYAKNGFYKILDKIYYFDEDGHMVLGPCKDNTGNEYFFSYETGELLEGPNQK